ncbi:hypothetical protein GW17_00013566 [Ensete ventricosum]|nr:hypothetical protein GW17_00013566 [Ensete ventricosum]
MSTRQEARDERESGAARKAADELAPSQSGHEREGAREKHHPGVLGSIKEGTKSLLGAITGRTQEAAEKTSEKAGQTKDGAVEKAKEYKDTTVEKLGEYKDTGTEKAREGTETAKQKMEEYKDAAADAARKARDYFAGTGEATKKLEEAERAREREEESRSTEVHRDDDTEKGRDDKGGTVGAVGSVAERVKEKLTSSKDEGDKAADEPKRGAPESVDPHGKM